MVLHETNQEGFDMQTKTQTEPARDAAQIFLTGPQVLARYNISHVTRWRWTQDEDLAFPQPMRINRLLYWKLSDLEQWEAAQAAKGAA